MKSIRKSDGRLYRFQNHCKSRCFRCNPINLFTGNDIIGRPEEAKYGLPHDQLIEAYRIAEITPSASNNRTKTRIKGNMRQKEEIHLKSRISL